MGRKKKKVEEPQEQKETLNEKSSTSVGYKGSVKVSVRYGNKVLSSKKYHNDGLKPLFVFLANCLLGNNFENYRPKFIRIFTIGEAGNPVPQNANNFNELIGNVTTKELTSISIIYSSEPNYDSVNAKVTFKFVIPFTQITSTTYKDINMFALYSQENSDNNNIANASAYVILRDGDNLSEAVNLEGTINPNEYNLFIEWTMGFN